MEPGVYYGLPDDDYHLSAGVSNSGLTIIREYSPAHYIARKAEPRVETPAKFDGKCLHAAILEPTRFELMYAACPKFDLRTNIGKAGKAEWDAAHPGIIPVAQASYDDCRRARDAVHRHPRVREIFAGVRSIEESIYARDPITHALVKARPDITHGGGIADLKSTEDAREEAFSRALYNYGYFQQAAFYSDVHEWHYGRSPGVWEFIVFEKEPPYGVKVYEIDAAALRHGRDAYRGALDVYAECFARDVWPGYDEGVTQIGLPPWIEKKLDSLQNDEIVGINYVE